MHRIQLADHVYEQVKRRADVAGFASVDEYIVDMLANDESGNGPNIDELFTPERIAHLDQISSEIKAGAKTYSMDEVSEHLAQQRADWIRENGN